jgi:hypothetical protein
VTQRTLLSAEMKGNDVSPPKGHHVATKERLAAMAASRCGVCSGAMVLRLVEANPSDGAMELRTYECDACGHGQTYSVTGGDS